MAIRDIFKMIKADRYTQDGREELIKAQEAVTEDVTYKPGDISRKTGLQKQPDGSWAPVKNAPAQKKNVHGAEVDKIYEQHINRIKELRKKGYSDEQIEKDKVYQQTKEAMRNVGKESISGSGLSERAQYSVSQTAAGMSTEALKSHVDKLKNDPVTRNSISNPDAMAKAYEAELAKRKGSASGSAPSASSDWKSDLVSKLDTEKLKQMNNDFKEFEKSGRNISPEAKERNDLVKAELAKRGETVTKMSDLVAQKSRPESAPTGRQPTPEMLEREKMRQAQEAKARRDKLDAEHPRTETGAPSELKIQGMSKEEYIPWRMKTYKENEAQASSMWNHFAEQQKNKGKENEYDPDFHPLRDSAPRILTGDCKVRIKKSK